MYLKRLQEIIIFLSLQAFLALCFGQASEMPLSTPRVLSSNTLSPRLGIQQATLINVLSRLPQDKNTTTNENKSDIGQPQSFMSAREEATRNFIGRSMAWIIAPFALIFIAIMYPLIKLTSPGPGIFKQIRMGYKGELFTVFKLRTFDKRGEKINAWGKLFRGTGLDETSQIFHILREKMVWIGPRPRVPNEVTPLYLEKVFSRTSGGIYSTSAIIEGPGSQNHVVSEDLTVLDSLEIDVRGIRHDIKILKRMARAGIKGAASKVSHLVPGRSKNKLPNNKLIPAISYSVHTRQTSRILNICDDRAAILQFAKQWRQSGISKFHLLVFLDLYLTLESSRKTPLMYYFKDDDDEVVAFLITYFDNFKQSWTIKFAERNPRVRRQGLGETLIKEFLAHHPFDDILALPHYKGDSKSFFVEWRTKFIDWGFRLSPDQKEAEDGWFIKPSVLSAMLIEKSI